MAAAVAVTCTALLPTGAGGNPHEYYVAIGASEIFGYQPTSGGLHAPTHVGNVHDLAVMERTRLPGIAVVRIACPEIRMELALAGGGRFNLDPPRNAVN